MVFSLWFMVPHIVYSRKNEKGCGLKNHKLQTINDKRFMHEISSQ
jgi:hypothetical protein